MNTGKDAGVGAFPVGHLIQALRTLNPLYNMLPRGTWDFPRDFFLYGQQLVPLAAGATASATIQIQADSDFLIVAGTRDVRDAATGLVIVPNPPLLVQILDSGSGRNLESIATPLDNWFGTGQLPGYWPFPKFIKRSSTITTTFTNLDGGNGFNVRWSYMGVKLFPNPAMGL